jgi:hypothetical protein
MRIDRGADLTHLKLAYVNTPEALVQCSLEFRGMNSAK